MFDCEGTFFFLMGFHSGLKSGIKSLTVNFKFKIYQTCKDSIQENQNFKSLEIWQFLNLKFGEKLAESLGFEQLFFEFKVEFLVVDFWERNYRFFAEALKFD